MKFGVDIYPTPDVPRPDLLARLVEERGFESLLFPEHTHMPADGKALYPGGGPHARILDQFIALTLAAEGSERLLIGTGICLIVNRDPIITAKQVATLDQVSGGRLLLGIGGGWNEEQIRNHGTDPSRRFAVMRERVEAMRAIWTEDEASYHGRSVSFGPIWSWPKPLQRPNPPILIGGNGPRVLDRVLAFGDGWYPNATPDPGAVLGRAAELRRRAAEAGRPVTVSLNMAPPDPAYLTRCIEAGTERAVFRLPQVGRAELEAHLDALRDVVATTGIQL